MPHGYKKEDPTIDDDVDDPSLSENIDESPLKRDGRITESENKHFKIPEFPYNENNIKRVQRGSIVADKLNIELNPLS